MTDHGGAHPQMRVSVTCHPKRASATPKGKAVMTPEERLNARIAGLTDDQLKTTWAALKAKPCKIPKPERLILNPRVMGEMQSRGLDCS